MVGVPIQNISETSASWDGTWLTAHNLRDTYTKDISETRADVQTAQDSLAALLETSNRINRKSRDLQNDTKEYKKVLARLLSKVYIRSQGLLCGHIPVCLMRYLKYLTQAQSIGLIGTDGTQWLRNRLAVLDHYKAPDEIPAARPLI
jgi:hypothetical protein